MRLFGKVDGAINRFDRAEWLTPIFDKLFGAASGGESGDDDRDEQFRRAVALLRAALLREDEEILMFNE